MKKILPILEVFMGSLSIVDTLVWVIFHRWFNESLRRLEPPIPERNMPSRILTVTPARNEEDNIGSMIESLQKQDYRNYTLVIVDDASTDNTPNIVKGYASRDSRIKINKNIYTNR